MQVHQEPRSNAKLPLPVLCALLLLVGLGVGGGTMTFVLKRQRTAADAVVAIDGVPITAAAFYRKLETKTGPDAIAKLTEDALALKFAESLGATPSAAALEERVRKQQLLPGWSEFAEKHHLTMDDVRQICRLQLARDLAVRACNATAEPKEGGLTGIFETFRTKASDRPVGAQYVERFAEFRKSAKIEVFAKQYTADISGGGQ
jgi:hypothetical protein